LDALREQRVEKIVYASTSGTIGISKDAHTIATDDSDTVEHIAHRWPYYLSKIYAERVVHRFMDTHGMPIVTMRPSLLLGPGDHQESSTGDIVDFLARKIPTTPSGGIAFVDVRDAADAFILAMDQAQPGSSYLVNACNLTLEDLFQRLEDLSGVRAPRLQLPEKTMLAGVRFFGQAMKALGVESSVDPVSVDMAQHFWYVDAARAKLELGWSPRSSNDTLRDTIKDIRERRPELDPDVQLNRRMPPSEFVPEETLSFLREIQKYPEP
ncbi:MAG: NAD-dependent epimerase/dehydratase family protein, partial [Myxococcota bacterium]